MRRVRLASPLLVVAAVLVSAASACTSAPDTNPLAGKQLYRLPDSPAEQPVTAWEAAGRTADAAMIGKIADRPTAKWFSADPNLTTDVNAVVSAAARAGQVPVLVAYNIPMRDCGGFSGGGAGSSVDYLDWINRFAAGLG